jgi:uncharacterized protein (TIGR02996 family)
VPKPKPAFPLPAAALTGEADILANVLADLSDHDAKLVYADWLEEHGDARGPLLRQFVTAHRAGKKLPPTKAAPGPWRNLLGLTLIEKLNGHEIAPQTDKLLALAKPSIEYQTPKAAEKSIPVGASKFGGRPDLPPDLEWPIHDGDWLSFLGQFNLAELRASPVARELPASGLLSAFCVYHGDGDDWFPDGTWRLFYFPDTSKLVRREIEAELPDDTGFPSCRVEYAETLTLPKWGSPWASELEAIGIGEYGDPFSDIYYDLSRADRILGYPCPIQGDILGKKSMRHLLTISGNDNTGWEFGDGGALYFTLKENDLKAGRFDRVKMDMDCA